MRPMKYVTVALTLLGAFSQACSATDRGESTRKEPATAVPSASASAPDTEINPRLLRRYQPIREGSFGSPSAALVALGQALFNDPRLSLASDVSCRSCHDLGKGGVDGEKTSRGHKGKRGERNAPTVLNAAGHFAQFWDGRAATVEEQAKGPILNADEMAMPSGDAVVRRLKAIAGYRALFQQAFPDSAEPITYDGVGQAIGAFERRLVTPGRWDRYLEGDKNALTAREREGLKTFLNVGCMVCHTGPLLGASTFERVGVVEPWPNQGNPGRMKLSGAATERMSFKVPSLRNVAETAPYFHDGSGATLEQAVQMMGRHQLGIELTDDEVGAIAAWLRSLSGPVDPNLVLVPSLPR